MLLTRNEEEESSQRYETRERLLYQAHASLYRRGSTEVEEEEVSDTSRFKRKRQGVFEWTKLNDFMFAYLLLFRGAKIPVPEV